VDISDSARAAKSVYPVVKAVMLGAVPKDASCVVEVPPRAPPPNAPPGGRYVWLHFYSWLSCLGHLGICAVGCPCLCCATCCFPIDVQNAYQDNQGRLWDLDGRKHPHRCCERVLAYDD